MDGLVSVLMLCLVVFLIVRTFVLKSKEARAFKAGNELAAAGNHKGALASYLEAGEHWGLNVAHATPAQFIKDLTRLREILRRLSEQAKRLKKPIDIAAAEDLIIKQINIYSKKENLALVSGNLTSGPQADVDRLTQQLVKARSQIKAQCSKIAT